MGLSVGLPQSAQMLPMARLNRTSAWDWLSCCEGMGILQVRHIRWPILAPGPTLAHRLQPHIRYNYGIPLAEMAYLRVRSWKTFLD